MWQSTIRGLVPFLLALFIVVRGDTLRYGDQDLDHDLDRDRHDDSQDPAVSEAPTATFHIGDQDSGTPDPDVVKEARGLLSKTEYAGATVHFMPQNVEDPDCHVVTFEEKRHGGRCSRMAGGMPFCAVKNYVFPNHPDCLNMEPGTPDERPWASPQWFARLVTPPEDATTQAPDEDGETPPETTTAATSSGDRRQLTSPEVRSTRGAARATSRRRGREGRRGRRPASRDEEGS